MRATVYTASFGNHDSLREPVAQTVKVPWLYFTDRADIPPADTWTVRQVDQLPEGPRASARWFKMHPHLVADDAEIVLWIDANMVVDSPKFVEEALEFVGRGPIVAWRHLSRRCVYTEAEFCARRADVPADAVKEQMSRYRSLHYPEGNGLYATGMLLYDLRDERTQHLAEAWYEECARSTLRDQLSLPFVAWSQQVEVAVFPYDIFRGARVNKRIDRLVHENRLARRAVWALRLKRNGATVARVSALLGAVRRSSSRARPDSTRRSPTENPWFSISPHSPAE